MKYMFVCIPFVLLLSLSYAQNTRQAERVPSSSKTAQVKNTKQVTRDEQPTRTVTSTNRLEPVPVPDNKPVITRTRIATPPTGNLVPTQKPERK